MTWQRTSVNAPRAFFPLDQRLDQPGRERAGVGLRLLHQTILRCRPAMSTARSAVNSTAPVSRRLGTL